MYNLRYSCAIFFKFGVTPKSSVSNVYENLSSGSHTENVQIDGQTDRRTSRLISFHLKRALLWQFYVIDNIKVFVHGVRYWCQTSTKFVFFRMIFIEILSIKYHGRSSSESCADLCCQTDGHDGANRRFSRL
jgi:hypothetical protein